MDWLKKKKKKSVSWLVKHHNLFALILMHSSRLFPVQIQEMEIGTEVANYSHSFHKTPKKPSNFQAFVPYISYYCMPLFWVLVIRPK